MKKGYTSFCVTNQVPTRAVVETDRIRPSENFRV